MNLKDALDVRGDWEQFDFFIIDERHHEGRYKVKFYDESYDMDGTFYLCGHEYGATHLICANNESDAYEAWIDLLPTIPPSDVHEAHNSYDKLVDFMVAKGHENDGKLRDFCCRWSGFYFDVDTRDANQTGAWDRWDLDEAYRMQSNCTDTGIVYIGHNEWMDEIDPSMIEVVRKSQVPA
jgi:hypothetical protein